MKTNTRTKEIAEKPAITFSLIKKYILEKVRVLKEYKNNKGNKRVVIIGISVLVVLGGIVAGWNVLPDKNRNDIVSKVTSVLGLQADTLDFLTQSTPIAYANNLRICTATGMWQQHTPTSLTSLPQWYNDNIQFYIGNIVMWGVSGGTTPPPHHNCNPIAAPGGTCEQYVCVPNNITLPSPLPNQPIQGAGLCPQGANIGDQCQLVGSSVTQQGVCLGVTPQGQLCKDPASPTCMGVNVPCGNTDTIGCSDGQREGFVDITDHPNIAGCFGGRTKPGLDTSDVCDNMAGDDSGNPLGDGCAAEDICADGWDICDQQEMIAIGETCDDAGIGFFTSKASGPDTTMCNYTDKDDVFGCGTIGAPAHSSCNPIERFAEDGCSAVPGLVCQGNNEYNIITNTDYIRNGVMCCRSGGTTPPANACGSRHEGTYYDGSLLQNDPNLCAQGTIIPGSWIPASPPDGWEWRCSANGGPIVSPTPPGNQVECRADVAYCGDKKKNGPEECDYNDPNTPNCTTECTFTQCGNGEVEYGEACDDGNTTPGDGCSATCEFEGTNECTIPKIEIRTKSWLENNEWQIVWIYDDGAGASDELHIYDVGTVNNCDDLISKVAKEYCGGDYYDISGLEYDGAGCYSNGNNGERAIDSMQGSIKCCNDTVCDDDAGSFAPDPDTQTCEYPYTGPSDSFDWCKEGIQICDDNEFGVCIPLAQHLGTTEVCGNNFDDDCDGEVDESGLLWYEDADGDGYGNPNTVINSCDQPDNYVDNGDDCNDDNSSINPGAADVCADGIDQDCSGADSTNSCSNPEIMCYEDVDNDGYGAGAGKIFNAAVCPDGWVTNNTDCDDSPSTGADVHAYITCQQLSSADICEDVQVCALTCPALPEEGSNTTCNDGIDNDCDGNTDGSDNSCEVCQGSIPDHASACLPDGAFAGNTTEYWEYVDTCSTDVCEFTCNTNYEWVNGECELIDDQCEEIYCPNPGDPGENCTLVPAEIDSNGCTIECATIVCDCEDIDNDNICDEDDDCIDIDEDGVCDDEDCDDTNGDIYPGAGEICDDGIDNDCDGDTDEDDDECSHNSGGGSNTGGNNFCGDGRIRSTEECDDGNSRSGDGCSSNCQIEDDDYEDDNDNGQNTKEVFADYLTDALNRLEKACDYDDYNYQDIMFRDVEWDPDNEAVNTLLAYCIVKGYDRTRNTKYHTDAATSKAEAIKVLAKLDAMGYSVPFDEKGYVRGTLPYKDMKPNAWYTTYVMYAHAEGLLEGIGNNKLIGSELKALTPIKKSEMRELLRNAGVDKEYRELTGFGQYIYRDDMANIMVDAFQDKLKDYQYLYGNNIKLYTMMVQKLNNMTPSKQLSYVRGLVKKLKNLDHRMMGENFNLHLRGMIEFLENILQQVE